MLFHPRYPFFLRWTNETELTNTQENNIEIEDNMITFEKMKMDSIRLLVQGFENPLL